MLFSVEFKIIAKDRLIQRSIISTSRFHDSRELSFMMIVFFILGHIHIIGPLLYCVHNGHCYFILQASQRPVKDCSGATSSGIGCYTKPRKVNENSRFRVLSFYSQMYGGME